MKNSSATHYARTRLTTTEVQDSLAHLQNGAIVEDVDEVRADSDLMRCENNRKVYLNRNPRLKSFLVSTSLGPGDLPLLHRALKFVRKDRCESWSGFVTITKRGSPLQV